jgi:hypothetical protein
MFVSKVVETAASGKTLNRTTVDGKVPQGLAGTDSSQALRCQERKS